MFKGIIRGISSLFRVFRKREAKKEENQSPIHPEVRRVALMVSQLKVYKRRNADVRELKVLTFSDAQRFLLRLCDNKRISHCISGGNIKYRVQLPDGLGNIYLTGRVRKSNTSVVARMTIDIPTLTPQIREILFVSKNHLSILS